MADLCDLAEPGRPSVRYRGSDPGRDLPRRGPRLLLQRGLNGLFFRGERGHVKDPSNSSGGRRGGRPRWIGTRDDGAGIGRHAHVVHQAVQPPQDNRLDWTTRAPHLGPERCSAWPWRPTESASTTWTTRPISCGCCTEPLSRAAELSRRAVPGRPGSNPGPAGLARSARPGRLERPSGPRLGASGPVLGCGPAGSPCHGGPAAGLRSDRRDKAGSRPGDTPAALSTRI